MSVGTENILYLNNFCDYFVNQLVKISYSLIVCTHFRLNIVLSLDCYVYKHYIAECILSITVGVFCGSFIIFHQNLFLDIQSPSTDQAIPFQALKNQELSYVLLSMPVLHYLFANIKSIENILNLAFQSFGDFGISGNVISFCS